MSQILKICILLIIPLAQSMSLHQYTDVPSEHTDNGDSEHHINNTLNYYEGLRQRILGNLIDKINDISNLCNESKEHGYNLDTCAYSSAIELTRVYDEIIKFCRTSGCIEFQNNAASSKEWVCVTRTGKEFSSVHLDKVYDDFVQCAKNLKRNMSNSTTTTTTTTTTQQSILDDLEEIFAP